MPSRSRRGRPTPTLIGTAAVVAGVSDRSDASGGRGLRGSDERDELRTVAFRLREIQRLLGARVEQENRRLAAEGLEPVTHHRFFRPDPDADREE